jgi:hypothetical protein
MVLHLSPWPQVGRELGTEGAGRDIGPRAVPAETAVAAGQEARAMTRKGA